MGKTNAARAYGPSIDVPRRFVGKTLVLVDAAEFERLKRRVAELDDAIGKIRRGEQAFRNGKTRTVKSLSEISR